MRDTLAIIRDFLFIVFVCILCCFCCSDDVKELERQSNELVGKELCLNGETRVVTYVSIWDSVCYLDNGTKIDPDYVECLINKWYE